MTESVLDIMSGGTKAPGAFNKYSQIGDTISGVIESVEIWDVRNFNTGQTETWDDGTPQKQLRILFQADPGTWTPQGEDDTGMRAHYVKAWNPHLKSLRDGLAASGEKEPKSGAWWSIRYDHDQPNKSGYDTKIYVYQYQPPASDVSQMLGGQQQAQQPQQAAAQPQQQYQQPQQQAQVQSQQFQAPQPQQAPAQQQPVAPVAPAQAPMVATPQGQVDPATGELANFPAPVPAQQPQQQAQQPAQPQQQAQAPQQVQQQPGVDPWTGQPQAQQPQQQAQQPASQQVDPNAGMDSQIIKLVRGGIPDNVITQTLGVTAEQVAQIRATLG